MKKPSELNDPYDILGISQNSTTEEIRRAYYQMAHKYHPDHNKGNEKTSELEFIAIGKAYERLTRKKDEWGGDNAGFNYYNDLFKQMMDVADHLSKSDNPDIKFYGELVKRTLGHLS